MTCPKYINNKIKLFAWHIDKHATSFVRDTVIKLLLTCFGYRIEMSIVIEKVK